MGKDALARYGEFQRRLAQYTQELSAEMFPEGLPEGLSFSDLEEAAERGGNQVSRDLSERHVRARADRGAGGVARKCPECRGPLKPGQKRDRRLTTTRGQVGWTEQTTHCPRCRRAFSPSGPGPGA